MKTQILAALGEDGLQQATALNAALAANDRIKYAFSLLQMADEHAQHPEQPAPPLRQERLACGIDDKDLDGAVLGARKVGTNARIPRAARIMARIGNDIRMTAAPVPGAKERGSDDRLRALMGDPPVA